jgi:biopolymer transport protein ExbD
MALKKGSKVSAEFNMSSLTDIIFLLLIFFMLTSTLVSPNAINLKLPSSSQSAAASTRQPIKISVTEHAQYLFNGQAVGFEGLKTNLQGAIRKDGRTPKEITVILDIHPSVTAQKLVDVVEIITNAGTKMVLSTQAKAATPS